MNARRVVWIALAMLPPHQAGAVDAPRVRLNTVGYLPKAEKKASVVGGGGRFVVVAVETGKVVFEGGLSPAKKNVDTDEMIATADFSRLSAPGVYRIDAPGAGKSDPFRIGEDVYRDPFRVVTRAMYLWRCGTAVSGEHGGKTFAHAACHLDDAWLDAVAGRHEKAPSIGGWHDAGDYNKYVVNAGVTVGVMLRAWEDFGPAIGRVPLGLPEAGKATPEFLAEVRWELEWLLTMQAGDGSVYQKVSTKGFGGFVMPEREHAPRFFVPWGSAATADFVAMTATASRVFRPYDPAFADRCLAAARKSERFLDAHPDDHQANQTGFATGGYETRDPDERIWALAELWETTGDPAALRDLEARLRKDGGKVDAVFDWGEVRDLGVFTYLFSNRRGRDPAIVARLRAGVVGAADWIVSNREAHGYARPMAAQYYWGCNGAIARQAVVLHAAWRIDPKPSYRATILDALNHLLGRNVHGRSYVTGLGASPPLKPHDRRSGADTVAAPWPGYLVGGPHPKARDWHDDEADYRTNEIAVNWNAALIYALAAELPER